MSTLATSYYQSLQGRQHSFPSFPVQHGELAWAGDVLSEIEGAIRRGECNEPATIILEHRRTRAVLIAGFRTINEAVRSIGPVMSDSMRRFERSVSDDVARNVIDEIRRVEQERRRSTP